jgi:hypothetical protein
MSLTSMLVSYVGSTITVKIPVSEAPANGLPFNMSSSMTPTFEMVPAPANVTSAVEGLEKIYTITVDPAQSYMVRTGTFNVSGPQTGPSTMAMIQGESYQLQPAPFGGNVQVFKNLDPVAPQLVSITTLSAYNSANPDTTVEVPAGSADGKAYYIAKFSEGVMGVTNQSFNVTQNGASSQPQTVQSLWLTGNVLSTTTTSFSPASALHLVTVTVPINTGTTPVVTLKTEPTIVSVQEMSAGPSTTETNSANSFGNPSGNVSWLKVNLEASPDLSLLQNGTPKLSYTFAGDEFSAGRVTEVTPNYAVQGTNSKVIYLGFNSNSVVQEPTEAPTSIAFNTTMGSQITDRAGNTLGSNTSVTAAKYLDATGEPVFSKWGDDTTTISDASVLGYANGASVTPNVNAPRYFTDGMVSKDATTGKPLYESNGDRIGMDTIDLSGIKSSPIIINANKGEAYVYVDGKALLLDVSDYDRYILNDRFKGTDGKFALGNEFYGTVDSEYVVVGSGGDNYLVAGNQGATDISSAVIVKNYQFSSAGIVRETDIVDYSQLDNGVTINLGDSARQAVSVVYKDGTTQADTIFGFEGVVGSRGNDDISGSNVGNALAGGAGNDELSGYTAGALGDKLYNQTYLTAEYGSKGTSNYKEAQFLVDSSDILYGGAGADKLYGGAGRDMLIDLGKAEMWGSNTGRNADGSVSLRSSAAKDLAENDVFWVRGDGAETATVNNFHLSKDGTGLAGRSNSANDAIMFSVDSSKLGAAFAGLSGQALYNNVYSRLSFEQKIINTDDIELVVNFKNTDGSSVKVGSTIIADIGSMLNGGANRAEVVELKWLSKVDDPLYLFNPKIDMDLANFVETKEFGNALNIAVALELQQAGTVRGTNEFGVMAAKLSDNDLIKRVYNPGDKDDRILGTANNDSYEYVVQKFNESVLDNNVGEDAIFDIGGTNDVLTFESAAIEKLTFSAVKVGRESHANSLRVNYEQTAALDGDSPVINRGEVTWQGHFQEGGRQAAETLQILGRDYAIAQASYEYDSKGYVKGGPKITADNARDVIMVGQGANDKFVFDVDPAAARVGQSARIAGFDKGDSIDISSYVTKYGTATTSSIMQDGTVEVAFGSSAFKLELTFQDAVVPADLLFLYT